MPTGCHRKEGGTGQPRGRGLGGGLGPCPRSPGFSDPRRLQPLASPRPQQQPQPTPPRGAGPGSLPCGQMCTPPGDWVTQVKPQTGSPPRGRAGHAQLVRLWPCRSDAPKGSTRQVSASRPAGQKAWSGMPVGEGVQSRSRCRRLGSRECHSSGALPSPGSRTGLQTLPLGLLVL